MKKNVTNDFLLDFVMYVPVEGFSTDLILPTVEVHVRRESSRRKFFLVSLGPVGTVPPEYCLCQVLVEAIRSYRQYRYGRLG
jgi:hypothetical protein